MANIEELRSSGLLEGSMIPHDRPPSINESLASSSGLTSSTGSNGADSEEEGTDSEPALSSGNSHGNDDGDDDRRGDDANLHGKIGLHFRCLIVYSVCWII